MQGVETRMLLNTGPLSAEQSGMPQNINETDHGTDAEDTLFEDILDVEGSLRLTPAPSIDHVFHGIEALDGRIPASIMAQLRGEVRDLRAFSEARDDVQASGARTTLVHTLTALRGTLA